MTGGIAREVVALIGRGCEASAVALRVVSHDAASDAQPAGDAYLEVASDRAVADVHRAACIADAVGVGGDCAVADRECRPQHPAVVEDACLAVARDRTVADAPFRRRCRCRCQS